MPGRRANPEDGVHRAVLDYIRVVMPAALVWHPPNGGSREPREAAKLVGLGVTAGIFDLQLYLPGGRIACIEVKAPGKDLSADQRDIAAILDKLGIPWACVHGIDETRIFLRTLGVPMREARQ